MHCNIKLIRLIDISQGHFPIPINWPFETQKYVIYTAAE